MLRGGRAEDRRPPVDPSGGDRAADQSFLRSRGQHANVTASRVEAVFDVAASVALDEARRERLLARAGATVTAVAQDARGQARNRELALQRLAAKIAAALSVPRRRRPTRPTRASRHRRLEQKRRLGERKRGRRRPSGEE